MPLPRIEMRVTRSVPKANRLVERLLLMLLSQMLILRTGRFLIQIQILALNPTLTLVLTPKRNQVLETRSASPCF